MKNNIFLFAIWPGISVLCLVGGILVRYVLLRNRMTIVKEEMSHWWKALCKSRLWQLSMAILIAGHLGALLLPQLLLQWNVNPVRLYLLEACALAVGLVATCSTAILMWRYLNEKTGSMLQGVFETIFLTLIFVGLLSGIGIAVVYRWGSSWAAITLAPYLSSFLRGKPATDYVLEMPSLIRLHVFCAFSALAVIPLTRLSLALVYVIDAGLGFAGQSLRPIATLGGSADVALRTLSSRLWPEED